jgi:hypothetical protein
MPTTKIPTNSGGSGKRPEGTTPEGFITSREMIDYSIRVFGKAPSRLPVGSHAPAALLPNGALYFSISNASSFQTLHHTLLLCQAQWPYMKGWSAVRVAPKHTAYEYVLIVPVEKYDQQRPPHTSSEKTTAASKHLNNFLNDWLKKKSYNFGG